MGTMGQSITLANSIIGVGILAMPFCFQQCGVILATLILLFMGLVSRLCCHFLLKSAILARRRNYEFLAFHVFGPTGKMAVEVGIIGFLMGTCIAYFVVVGDLGPQIISKMFNINQSDTLRTSIMVIVSLVCVLPLGLLRNVDSLSNVSAATIGFYFCLVIKVIVEASQTSSEWHKVRLWRVDGMLQCVPIFSMALFCQTQLFEIFESMPSIPLEKMNAVIKNAINICTSVYITIGLFGYLAFSKQDISGNILMSLSPTMASDVIKLGFVMSLAFSFPLIIFPCRASLYSLLYRKSHESEAMPARAWRRLTGGVVGGALGAGLVLPNVALVLGLVGATIGVLVCLVLPAACLVALLARDTSERALAKGVIVLGFVIMVLGTLANLQAAEVTLVTHDEKIITQERIDKIVQDFFEKQHNDDVINPSSKDISDNLLIDKNVMKDSEVQPPNPVPPNYSNENNEKPIEVIKEVKQVFPETKPAEIKISETHPKDLKTKLNGNKQDNIERTDKIAVKQKEEIAKPSSNEDKIHIMKQQKLIETIKQHGEEQKELMKEQKEILDEIIKRKQESEQNKNEVDTQEAKKIAVESIKQIANIIQNKMGGVSDKPAGAENKKESEKLTNEAVQEIAKKAVETIEAIQEIPKAVLDSKNSSQKDSITAQKVEIIQKDSQNVEIKSPRENLQKQENLEKTQQINNNEALPDLNKQVNISADEMLSNKIKNNENIKTISAQIQNKVNENQSQEAVKPHSHSPDESQSYKQGEDKQANVDNMIKRIPNKPLPLVINDKLKAENANKLNVPNSLNNNIKEIPQAENAKVEQQKDIPVARQKREVVDCTEKTLLKPEDKQICEKLINTQYKSSETLQNVDLNDVGLRQNVPIDLGHVGRSLKTYDETEKNR